MKPLAYYRDLHERTRPGTPGPWIVDVGDDHTLIVRSINGPAEAIIPDERDPDAIERQARRLAALPELHEALGELLADRERLMVALRSVLPYLQQASEYADHYGAQTIASELHRVHEEIAALASEEAGDA